MSEPPAEPFARRGLLHIVVPGSGEDVGYRGRAGGSPSRIRQIGDRRGHAAKLRSEVDEALSLAQQRAGQVPAETRPDGFTLVIEGWSDEPGYELALRSLDTAGARLLAVIPPDGTRPERALIWMTFGGERGFLRKLDQYAQEQTRSGTPRHQRLVANIANLRLAVMAEFWQEDGPFPDVDDDRWWEIWFARIPGEPDPLESALIAAESLGLETGERTLTFAERTVVNVRGSANRVGQLFTTNAVIAEVHRPRVIAEMFAADVETQAALVADLAARAEPAEDDTSAVCLLDTGVAGGHPLLKPSLDTTSTVVASAGTADTHGHGTQMAGLALYGDLNDQIMENGPLRLRHRLESVKMFEPARPETHSAPEMYGAVTAEAVAVPETERPQRRRVYSMPISAAQGSDDGAPSSWSAALDALAIGTDVRAHARGIDLLGVPDRAAARLLVVSAGNVYHDRATDDYLALSDQRPIQDPGQAWNVLTVGAFTELIGMSADPSLSGYRPLAQAGELSPFSRTSVPFEGQWPVKPDIVLEGGNLLADGTGVPMSHDVVDLLTTSRDGLLTTTRATSAATAQAGRLAALAFNRYPSLWPETVRGLLVHAAQWSPPMWNRIGVKNLGKRGRMRLLRRYGWGIPTEDRVLASASSDVTMIVEDEFQPFERTAGNVSMRALRIHRLPWPREQLADLEDAEVRLRVTVSYFVEPNPSSRGWDVRYRYPSHQLRFDLKRPTETVAEFQARVSREAQQEEENRGAVRRTTDSRWLVGWDGRHKGSLHADAWTGSGADLAECGHVSVTPVGGWWKDHRRKDRAELPVRYALLVSLTTTSPVDIYTPIANEINIPVDIVT
jgi:hypothetical protein